MSDLKRRAINFDLDTKIMKEKGVYPNGYKQIEELLKKCGFTHRQGSGYESTFEISSNRVKNVIKKVVKENPWLADCVKKVDVTDIGKQYDLIPTIKRFAKRYISKDKADSTEKKLTEKDKQIISNIRASKISKDFNRFYSGQDKLDKWLWYENDIDDEKYEESMSFYIMNALERERVGNQLFKKWC